MRTVSVGSRHGKGSECKKSETFFIASTKLPWSSNMYNSMTRLLSFPLDKICQKENTIYRQVFLIIGVGSNNICGRMVIQYDNLKNQRKGSNDQKEFTEQMSAVDDTHLSGHRL